MWATIWETAKYLIPMMGATVAWWVRDRRKDQAAAEVAERTVQSEVVVKEAGAEEARLVYIQREMDLEREFHRQLLADRDTEIERQRGEIRSRDMIIENLRMQIEDMRQRLTETLDELDSVRDQLDRMIGPDEENP